MMKTLRMIEGIDFSRQPDDEIWYVSTDGKVCEQVLPTGGYGSQPGLEVVSNTYENGLGRVKLNTAIQSIGGSYIREQNSYTTINIHLVSFPRQLHRFNAFTFWATHLQKIIFLYEGTVFIHNSYQFRPKCPNLLCVWASEENIESFEEKDNFGASPNVEFKKLKF
ncbi:hypothetical protein [Prevotella sp. KH2C16]|uniref:hypothetical protein n=1 Tax=Prevotella sp. KH2C16 TaxID=1855325 RepID=UPI0008EFA575|nr:hypothetical protein [Prevotella sp. KH2C16]SFG38025.1 hypothetical protein SAMN05216383_1124 [Prevotella sp. KH2C16]SFG75676.1 hypothetical protein SAMN05216383_13918 [Prevotella sp. KH2C16]